MKKTLIVGIPILILVMGFTTLDTTGLFERPPMREYYIKRMQTFHEKQHEKCRYDAMTFAMSQVDSVLTGKKLLVQIDSFILLPRPTKPKKPIFDFDIDTMPVDPLFKKRDNYQ